MNFMVGINFNTGKPRDPTSLHYLNPNGQPNQYEFAIKAAGKVLEYYDSDQEFPVYGFGGCICGLGSHLFPLTLINNPVVKGVSGILEAYKKAIPQLEIIGDTVFQPIVYTAAQLASEYKRLNNGKYLVLMIITDGTIIDIDATIHEIVNASILPLSIILVGIGSADFGNMVRLDGDEEKLESNGIECKRDIVQFVSMREYLNKDAFQLTKSLLEELPNQFISYMSMNNILPTTGINKGNTLQLKYNNSENNTLMDEICGNNGGESKNNGNESILKPNLMNNNDNNNNVIPNQNAVLNPSNSAPSIQQTSTPQQQQQQQPIQITLNITSPTQQPQQPLQSSPIMQPQQPMSQQQQQQYYPQQQQQPFQPSQQPMMLPQQPFYPQQPPQQQQPQYYPQQPNQYGPPQPRYYPQQPPPQQQPQYYPQQQPPQQQYYYPQQQPRTAQMMQQQPRTPYYPPQQQNMPRGQYYQPLQQPYQPPNTPRPVTMNFPPPQILSRGGFVPPW